jgi:bifunctional lysine-specific demethylase and histidyl-hydroxylase NO66
MLTPSGSQYVCDELLREGSPLTSSPGSSGRVTIEPSLAWLLQPLTVETFLDEIWGATHYHVKRSCAGYFDSLLSGPSVVEELLERYRPDPSTVRLAREDDQKDPATHRLADGGLDVVRVRDAFADGYTIVLRDVDQYVREVGLLTRSLEVELNFQTSVNAYLTPAESQGFAAHCDDHDVLVLQIQGSKIWHLYKDTDLPPHVLQPNIDTAVLPLPTDLHLEVGDVLYVPRGRINATETTSEPSIHLTIGITAPTMHTLITNALHRLSFRDDRVYARLPPRYLGDEGACASLDVLVRDMLRTAEDPSVIAETLDAIEGALVRRGRCAAVGPVVWNSIGIGGRTPVVRYQPLYSRVKAVAGGVVLQFADQSVSAGPDYELAMLFLSRCTERFRVCDLPGLRAAQQTELARTLIDSGFLVRLPDD